LRRVWRKIRHRVVKADGPERIHELNLLERLQIRAVFPHGRVHRALCALEKQKHSLSGPRLGGELGRVLHARRHRH
jgi:hypothetical protein